MDGSGMLNFPEFLAMMGYKVTGGGGPEVATAPPVWMRGPTGNGARRMWCVGGGWWCGRARGAVVVVQPREVGGG